MKLGHAMAVISHNKITGIYTVIIILPEVISHTFRKLQKKSQWSNCCNTLSFLLVESTVSSISVSIYHCFLVPSCYLDEKAQRKQKIHFCPF